MNLTAEQRSVLLQTARDSIEHGLHHHRALTVDAVSYEPRLREIQASFVTIHIEHRLRGCMGGLDPRQPLIQDVAHHAYLAAFSDGRFSPLTRDELPAVCLHLSLLSPREPIAFSTEAELLELLRPGIDGILLATSEQRGTFLPSVWETLPEPRNFIAQLKRKAGPR